MFGSDLFEFDPAHGRRPEFGELARRSGRMLNELGLAQITGAENLLAKATASAASGNVERAEQLIQRAAAMPYDQREEGSPGIRGAEMLVFSLVTDQLEASDEEDPGWLDVAVEVYAHLDGPGKAELASVMHGFVLQGDIYNVTTAEGRRIRQVFGHAPLEADLGDGPALTVEERREIIRSLIAAAVALRGGYAARG
jgi:hypothetical protein